MPTRRVIHRPGRDIGGAQQLLVRFGQDTDVAQAYQDVVARFLGEEIPLRYTAYEKPGFLQRLFGAK